MNEASENEASLLPEKITAKTFMEVCAARRDVVVVYSPRLSGARVICSASEIAIVIASPSTVRATSELPRKTVWSAMHAPVTAKAVWDTLSVKLPSPLNLRTAATWRPRLASVDARLDGDNNADTC